MAKLVILLCSLHSGACHLHDPLLAAMPALTCNIRQMQIAQVWAQENPEIVAGYRIARTVCVPPGTEVGRT